MAVCLGVYVLFNSGYFIFCNLRWFGSYCGLYILKIIDYPGHTCLAQVIFFFQEKSQIFRNIFHSLIFSIKGLLHSLIKMYA